MGKKEDELKKEGWEKQFTYDEPRLSEAVEIYKSLGFEVHLESPSEEEVAGDCGVCYEGALEKYKTIYTRKKTKTF
ncbi:MAG: hypothetical protein JSV56_06575 [Methanomassiliicoccales archaeon]|nr:MAG: hypothetical protein JSV56_06575 [Methanomassiliicoccales archaeon]